MGIPAALLDLDNAHLEANGRNLRLKAGVTPPGTWTQVVKGTTAVNDQTTATLTTINSVANGECLIVSVVPRGTTALVMREGNPDLNPALGEMHYGLSKTTTTGQFNLKVRHRASGAPQITYDWVVYKVAPA